MAAHRSLFDSSLERRNQARARSAQSLEQAGDPLGDGGDIGLGRYQGRGQHQRIADRADHQILVEEGGIEGARPAQARRTVDRGQVDAGGEANGKSNLARWYTLTLRGYRAPPRGALSNSCDNIRDPEQWVALVRC